MRKTKLTPKEIRILELATDVLEKVSNSEDELLSEQAGRALDDVNGVRLSYGYSEILGDEPD